MASRILDLPEPLRPVIALNDESHPVIVVRTGYDLNPKGYKSLRDFEVLVTHLQGLALRSSYLWDVEQKAEPALSGI
jgi:hypothetical protein